MPRPRPRARRGRARAAGRPASAGARGIHASTRREWVSFEAPDGAVVLLYWSQRDGVYYVTHEAAAGGGFEPAGRFDDVGAAGRLPAPLPGGAPPPRTPRGPGGGGRAP